MHIQDGELFIPAHLGSQIQPAAPDRLSLEDTGKPCLGTEPCREASPALLNGQSAPQSTLVWYLEISHLIIPLIHVVLL